MADKKNAKGKKKEKDGKDKSKTDKRPPKGVVSPRPTPPAPDGDADPPIIISGGSVKIASKYFLDVSYDNGTQRFIYETKAIKIVKMKMKGKKGNQDDDSDNGKFTIELFD